MENGIKIDTIASVRHQTVADWGRVYPMTAPT